MSSTNIQEYNDVEINYSSPNGNNTSNITASGVKIINNTTNGFLETNSSVFTYSPDGTTINTLDPNHLISIAPNTTPQEFVINNNLIVQDDDFIPNNRISLQSSVIGVGANFGIEYESNTNQDLTIQTTSGNTGGVLFKQIGIGSTTTQTKITQGTIVSSDTSNSNAITINPAIPSITIQHPSASTSMDLDSDLGMRFATNSAPNYAYYKPQDCRVVTGTSQVAFNGTGLTAQSSTGSVFLNTTGSITSTKLQDGAVNLLLYNSSATAGALNGVPLVQSYAKQGRNAVAGDVIGQHSFFAKDYTGNAIEWANITASVRNNAVGNTDGSIALSGIINGTMTEFFRVNGADSENNMFLPLDMNGQSIKSSSGNLSLSSTASTGTGSITLTSKTQSPTTQNDVLFVNNTSNTLGHSVANGWDFFANPITTSSGALTLDTTNSSGTGIIAINPKQFGYIQITSQVDALDYIRINPQTSANTQQLIMTTTNTSSFVTNINLLNTPNRPFVELKADFGGAIHKSIQIDCNGTGSSSNRIYAYDGQNNLPFQIVSDGITNGSIEFIPKDTTGDIIFTGTNIESATAGGNSGKHLRIKLNGMYYKIKLEDD